ncbi:MAG: RsmB/NOP family class I SAM-dependent RNA methyltransferase, partial [Alphaproteobacteria bacterium]|nr:RsmB/NOP family class I SAM-dependent RNA methyltransferase [Alphaproteobacteria bacterium]
GDYADWMEPHLVRALGEARIPVLAAQARRAPVDLRVNTLKTDRERALKALAAFAPEPHPVLADAIRIPAPEAQTRAPAVESAPEFQKGWFEVQDAGSQIVAALAGKITGAQVLDYCAGGGGKTLALAAAMANRGQIFAYDSDARRLSETVTRASRAGVRNLQVRSPLRADALSDLEGRMDLVFVDAPCTGSGVWRRHPGAKWRLTPDQMAQRLADQDAVLEGAARHVRVGGRLVYVTCSLFTEENEDRIAAFMARHPAFRAIPAQPPGELGVTAEGYLRLAPPATDGFFAAVLERAA